MEKLGLGHGACGNGPIVNGDVDTIVLAARQGNLAAFNDLVLAFQATAYNLAYRITGNSDAASDATQEAFLKAYRNLRQYRGGSFKAWLLRIVTNTCYDLLRACKRRPLESLPADDGDPDHDDRWRARSASPEAYAVRRETIDRIQAAILCLPAELRLVLVLRDVEGMSYEEVGQIAGIPQGTVKSRINRARARMRHILTECGELPSPDRIIDDDDRHQVSILMEDRAAPRKRLLQQRW